MLLAHQRFGQQRSTPAESGFNGKQQQHPDGERAQTDKQHATAGAVQQPSAVGTSIAATFADAHSGLGEAHIRAHSRTFAHIRSQISVACAEDRMKRLALFLPQPPSWPRTFGACTSALYNIKRAQGCKSPRAAGMPHRPLQTCHHSQKCAPCRMLLALLL